VSRILPFISRCVSVVNLAKPSKSDAVFDAEMVFTFRYTNDETEERGNTILFPSKFNRVRFGNRFRLKNTFAFNSAEHVILIIHFGKSLKFSYSTGKL
jgi:hypothetical protein